MCDVCGPGGCFDVICCPSQTIVDRTDCSSCSGYVCVCVVVFIVCGFCFCVCVTQQLLSTVRRLGQQLWMCFCVFVSRSL